MWVSEETKGILKTCYKVEQSLFEHKSSYQKVSVVQTKGFGKMLLNDDIVMVSERDEFIYHEMLAHVPLFLNPNAKRVLVVGGGDGGTAREVIKHSQVQKCLVVEIDSVVVEACKQHIPQTAEAYKDPKVELVVQDAVEFAKAKAQRPKQEQLFDVVLVDSTDPIGPATPLFGAEFYQNIKTLLAPGGIVVAQGESSHYELSMQTKMLSIFSTLFKWRGFYNFHNLTYPGVWSFLYASNSLHPLKDYSPPEPMPFDLKYYTPQVHRGSFALPNFLQKHFNKWANLTSG